MYWILFVVMFCVVYAIILFMLVYNDDEVCKARERKKRLKNSITVNDKVRMYETKLLLKQQRKEKKLIYKHNLELLKKYDLGKCVFLNSKCIKCLCSKKEKK